MAEQRRVRAADHGDQPGLPGHRGELDAPGEIVDVEAERGHPRAAGQRLIEVLEGEVDQVRVQAASPGVGGQHGQAQVPVEGAEPS